ncbi:NADPH-dependent FMN reductase [Streptomyces qinzhouensis]|uniref:NAD(P)H-dependent oxidoreductase n=1 Tax=Streptomyces qinzhouensis TaxID=2599401 RepID=A0A5B8IH35_9ACTN|nr:NAD(P)H-dependent oxidoreductase [Streptomyces qinzhouensis]QDY76639.1 NAD(P)H-dependent oxidoreductase [Streptomyces qinzhouensis]
MNITTQQHEAGSFAARDAEPMRLAVIVGSNRHGRFGPVIVDWFLEHTAGRTDFTTEVVDVGEVDLPTSFGPPPVPDGAAAVAASLAAADAFVVVTPEYNHSYPAALKNLIDWHGEQWHAKPVAFVSYGGVSGGLRAVEHLRQVFAELHATTLRDTVSFANAHSYFDAEGRHRDSRHCDAAAKGLLDRLAWWGQALREARAVRPYEAA